MKKLLPTLLLVAILALVLTVVGCSLGGSKTTTTSGEGSSTTVTGDSTSVSDTGTTASGDTSSSVVGDTGTTASGDTGTTAPGDTGTTGPGDTTSTSQDTTTSSAKASTTTSAVTGTAKTFKATLKGSNEVPAITTSATGTLTLTVDAKGTAVQFTLAVSKLSGAAVARLHEGAAGATGSTIFTLYAGPTKTGAFTGTLVKGSFTSKGLVGPLKGKTIADLVALIKSGKVYINIGTTKNSSGEIRGQLK
jgi:hypothetical protein